MRDRSLRRATDRVEDAVAWLLTVAGMVVLIGAGIAAVDSYAEGVERARTDRSDRVPATAVLLVDASARVGEHGSAAPFARVPARWTDTTGAPHEGELLARSTSPAGSPVPIWLDSHGQLARPPASEMTALTDAAAIGLVVLGLGGGAIAALWLGLRRVILAHNLRAWEREWARVGPEWNSQQPS